MAVAMPAAGDAVADELAAALGGTARRAVDHAMGAGTAAAIAEHWWRCGGRSR